MRNEDEQTASADKSLVERPLSPLGAEVLHCYAQAIWHDEAYLSGGRGALMALRSAIDAALRDGAGECDVFASDGEAYTVHVVAMSDADAERQVVPYTEEPARQLHPWNDVFGPWDVLRANVGVEPHSAAGKDLE